jgi:hypothetical protein
MLICARYDDPSEGAIFASLDQRAHDVRAKYLSSKPYS